MIGSKNYIPKIKNNFIERNNIKCNQHYNTYYFYFFDADWHSFRRSLNFNGCSC